MGLAIGALYSALSGLLFLYADHGRFVFDPSGKIVADRWKISFLLPAFVGGVTRRTGIFFTGDTGSGKTSGLNGLLEALMRRNPTLGGVVIANKGEVYFYLEWHAKKYGCEKDLIHLRPRLAGESGEPIHRLNVTGYIV